MIFEKVRTDRNNTATEKMTSSAHYCSPSPLLSLSFRLKKKPHHTLKNAICTLHTPLSCQKYDSTESIINTKTCGCSHSTVKMRVKSFNTYPSTSLSSRRRPYKLGGAQACHVTRFGQSGESLHVLLGSSRRGRASDERLGCFQTSDERHTAVGYG